MPEQVWQRSVAQFCVASGSLCCGAVSWVYILRILFSRNNCLGCRLRGSAVETNVKFPDTTVEHVPGRPLFLKQITHSAWGSVQFWRVGIGPRALFPSYLALVFVRRVCEYPLPTGEPF